MGLGLEGESQDSLPQNYCSVGFCNAEILMRAMGAGVCHKITVLLASALSTRLVHILFFCSLLALRLLLSSAFGILPHDLSAYSYDG